ncbi:MAG: mechanosensitive ion channel family protein [Deltaproteobacteria bacterium]|nr:mechanosensitive ion channel family protein [Candidatus Zymogenaceae bacterium]
MEQFMSFISQEFFGNTLDRYLYFFLVVIGFTLLAKIIYRLLKHNMRKITHRTATHIDTMIVDNVEEPLVLILIVAGFHFGFKILTLTEGAKAFIDRVILVVFLLVITWLIIRLLDVIIKGILNPLVEKTESKLDDQIIPVVSNLMKAAIWIMVIIVMLSELGYDVFSLITGLGLGGVAIAMAAKDTIGHMFGGFNIFMNKPFQIGDIVNFKGTEAVVEQVGIRMTTMRTWDNTLIYVPNSDIANSMLENISARNGRRTVHGIRICGDTPAGKIEAACAEIVTELAKNDGLMEKLRCHLYTFDDYALSIRTEFWIKLDVNYFDIRHQCNLTIKEILEKHDISLVSPMPEQVRS